MSNQEDTNCVPPSIDLINPAVLPTISSRNFDINAFVAELSGLEALQGEETLYIYEPPFPTLEEVSQAEKDIISEAGVDARFTGEAVHNFLFSHYRPLDSSDSYAAQSTLITLTGCTFDGDLYTYTVPNTSTQPLLTDSANKEILVPIYDLYNQPVIFPIVDHNGKFVLVESITAIDAQQKIIYFPFKDVNDNVLKYPFKGIDGNITVHLPTKNNKQINDAEEAFQSLDLAYDKAKDADAFKFVNYLLSLEEENKLGFFYGPLSMLPGAESSYFFTVGVYELSSEGTDLIDITHQNLKYFIRYYPDRAEYVYKLYKDFDGEGVWTLIEPTSSRDINTIIKNDKERNTSYASLTIPFWSSTDPSTVTYENNAINSSPVHTGILELYTNAEENQNKTTTLQQKVSTLENQLSSLSAQFVSLYNFVGVLSTSVAYNSAIIDKITDPLNWGNLWAGSPLTFNRPIDPAPRPGPPFP
jgi:hypothetical protein